MDKVEIYHFNFSDKLSLLNSRERNAIISDKIHQFVINHIAELFSKEPYEISIKKHPNGKPYAEGLPVHFNISHSGNNAAVVFSPFPIGIDIEEVKNYRSRIVDKCFTISEKEYLSSGNDEHERNCRFFEIWTAKEAFLKYTGKGLSGGFKFDTADNQGLKHELTSDTLGKAELLCQRFIINDIKFIISLCSDASFNTNLSLCHKELL